MPQALAIAKKNKPITNMIINGISPLALGANGMTIVQAKMERPMNIIPSIAKIIARKLLKASLKKLMSTSVRNNYLYFDRVLRERQMALTNSMRVISVTV